MNTNNQNDSGNFKISEETNQISDEIVISSSNPKKVPKTRFDYIFDKQKLSKKKKNSYIDDKHIQFQNLHIASYQFNQSNDDITVSSQKIIPDSKLIQHKIRLKHHRSIRFNKA